MAQEEKGIHTDIPQQSEKKKIGVVALGNRSCEKDKKPSDYNTSSTIVLCGRNVDYGSPCPRRFLEASLDVERRL